MVHIRFQMIFFIFIHARAKDVICLVTKSFCAQIHLTESFAILTRGKFMVMQIRLFTSEKVISVPDFSSLLKNI